MGNPGISLLNFIVALICYLPTVTTDVATSMYQLDQGQFMESLSSYQITTPMHVDHRGDLISYNLKNSLKRTPRSTVASVHKDTDRSMFYKIVTDNKHYHLDLKINTRLVAGKYQVEYWDENGRSWKHNTYEPCHYIGYIKNHPESRAAVSNCNGLHGVFATAKDEYIIEPLHNITEEYAASEGHPHLVYKRSAIPSHRQRHEVTQYSCGVVDDPAENSKEESSENRGHVLEKIKQQAHAHSRRRRSTSKENFVETLLVVDKVMLGYHGRTNIEPYILTIMNIVSNLYHDSSIGNSVNIVITRMILVMKDQEKLKISYHAKKSLDSFCAWQKEINPAPNSEAALKEGLKHHDNAVLMTRFDICTNQNSPCGTLGLASVGGMCEPDRSCSINEDTGLSSAFTIAHEMGHNFGMHHDGSGNKCTKAKIMAAMMNNNTDTYTWSNCSRRYITQFLESGKGHCLENPPPDDKDVVLPTELPGQVHSADEQCRLQHGDDSYQCSFTDVCKVLWCMGYNNTCITNSIPAAEGTKCRQGQDEKRWCYQGECVPYGYRPNAVDGGWGDWSSWGHCSRTCGGGVTISARHCDSPSPQHGGKYCLGERKRYKSCNIDDCAENSRDFRDMQCAKFDNEPFRGKYYTWKAFKGPHVIPCALYCVAAGYAFYTERAPQVTDGTQCHKGSLDVCVRGQCMHVGCDKILGSDAVKDRCGVCGGDGSTCETVSGVFEDDLPTNAYYEIITIPRESVNIEVSEVAVSGNYLALKSVTDEYYINGQWTVDWPRSFDVAGTIFKYERPTDKPETLTSPGPTTEDLVVALLLQNENLGVRYQYNVPVTKKASGDIEITFLWEHQPWSECSASCAKGEAKAPAVCLRSDDRSQVPSSYCNAKARPADRTKYCNTEPCPPMWYKSAWSPCSKTCGGGFKMRTVACISKVGPSEQETVPEDECMTRKPAAREKCGEEDCPPIWVAEPWGECTPRCGPGMKTRSVKCMSNDMREIYHPRYCNATMRPPPSRVSCTNRQCPPPSWVFGAWGECSADCGRGQQTRSVECRAYTGLRATNCDPTLMPPRTQECESTCVVENEQEECSDVSGQSLCNLVLKYNYCTRDYFKKLCCKSCLEQSQQ